MRLRDLAVLVDDVGDPPRVLVFRTVRRAVRDAELAIGIGDQRERELVSRRKSGVVSLLVEADADDLNVLLLVFRGEVPEPGTLCLSTRCVGLRIKPENDFAPAQIAKTQRTSDLIGRIEIGSGITGLEHVFVSSEGLERESEPTGEGHGLILRDEG